MKISKNKLSVMILFGFLSSLNCQEDEFGWEIRNEEDFQKCKDSLKYDDVYFMRDEKIKNRDGFNWETKKCFNYSQYNNINKKLTVHQVDSKNDYFPKKRETVHQVDSKNDCFPKKREEQSKLFEQIKESSEYKSKFEEAFYLNEKKESENKKERIYKDYLILKIQIINIFYKFKEKLEETSYYKELNSEFNKLNNKLNNAFKNCDLEKINFFESGNLF